MIFPAEYKRIGVVHLNEIDDSKKHFVYFLSEYLLKEVGDEGYSVHKVVHEGKDSELLRPVKSVEVIATEDQVFCYEKRINIKNRVLLIEKAAEICEIQQKKGNPINTVVFTGFDKHITFVHKPDLTKIKNIQVIDIRPPDPPGLIDCVRRLNESNIFGDLAVKFFEKVVDLTQYEGDNTMFPCSASELVGKCLDTDTIKENGYLLVGCQMSKRIFEQKFPGLKYDFVDLCPINSKLTKPEMPFVIRCCQVKNCGKIIHINGFPGIAVHWGVSEYETSEAVRKLAKYIDNQENEANEANGANGANESS